MTVVLLCALPGVGGLLLRVYSRRRQKFGHRKPPASVILRQRERESSVSTAEEATEAGRDNEHGHRLPSLMFPSRAAVRPVMLSGKYVPKTPTGHKRPAAVVADLVAVMPIATGEAEEAGVTEEGKSKAAAELGRRGGLARAKVLGRRRRVEIARDAATAKHKNSCKRRWTRSC